MLDALLGHVLLGILSPLGLFHAVFLDHVQVDLHAVDASQSLLVLGVSIMVVEGDVINLVFRENHLFYWVQSLLQDLVGLFRRQLLQTLGVPVIQTNAHMAALDDVSDRGEVFGRVAIEHNVLETFLELFIVEASPEIRLLLGVVVTLHHIHSCHVGCTLLQNHWLLVESEPAFHVHALSD